MFFPLANATWLVELEQEFLSWTGLPDEPADQIDAAAYAATYAKGRTFCVGIGSSPFVGPNRSIPGLWNSGRELRW